MPDKEKFEFTDKLDGFLSVLNKRYEYQSERNLQEIIVNSSASVFEKYEYDNWNGGIYGHAVYLYLPEDIFVRVIDSKSELERRIEKDMNELISSPDEYVCNVFLELKQSDPGRWREESGALVPSAGGLIVCPDSLDRLWGTYPVRVFLSHKSSCKVETRSLQVALQRCGVGSFVAHEDIEPTRDWVLEIERALFSMDCLVALLTDDYRNSAWTDQEVGVAIGRGVPLVAVRLGTDPYGLMGKSQGLGGCSWSDTTAMASKIFDVLAKKLPDQSSLIESAILAYRKSASFADSEWKVKNLLSRFSRLNESQISRLVESQGENKQNRHSFGGREHLQKLLCSWTGKNWDLVDDRLVLAGADRSDIPF